MDFTEYKYLAIRTADKDLPLYERLDKNINGVYKESGEVADLLDKHWWQGHGLDLEDLSKEIGDVFWYLADFCYISKIEVLEIALIPNRTKPEKLSSLRCEIGLFQMVQEQEDVSRVYHTLKELAESYDLNLSNIFKQNIAKLEKRFPDCFNYEDSVKRVDVEEKKI
jgi:NTP pyrophosphatase (non-canonical NTP hydrolase)